MKYKLKKLSIAIFMISILMIYGSFSAIVSDNDGAAFVTKAEFEALKETFNTQIDTYQTSIDSKIDGAIASYLAGRSGAKIQQINLYDKIGGVKFGSYIDYDNNEMVAFTLTGESLWANTLASATDMSNAFRLRRIMSTATCNNMDLENGSKGSTIYGGSKGNYLYVKKDTRGYELTENWSDYVVNHCVAGSITNSPGLTISTVTWDAITPFKNLNKFGTENFQWGPKGTSSTYHECEHLATVYNTHTTTSFGMIFSNTLPTSERICIVDEDEESIEDYHQGTVSTSNSTWGWVRVVGSNMGKITLPSADKIKYYLKKPKTTKIIPANNFINIDLSNLLEKKVLATDGAPFVVADGEGKLSFSLKLSCDTTGKTVKFGLHKNTAFGNDNTIDTNISDINLSSSDFNYNLDDGKTLDIEFDVKEGDIIYLKVDTTGLSYDSGKKTYYVTPTITNLLRKEE